MSQLVFQDLLLGSGARWIEDVFGEGLLPCRGNGVEGGEQKKEEQGAARSQEASGRDEPPSSGTQSQLEAVEGETTTDARQKLVLVEGQTLPLLLVFPVFQAHHDHSRKHYVQFSCVHTRPQVLSVGCQVSLGVNDLALGVFHVLHIFDHKLLNSLDQVWVQVQVQGTVGHKYQVSQFQSGTQRVLLDVHALLLRISYSLVHASVCHGTGTSVQRGVEAFLQELPPVSDVSPPPTIGHLFPDAWRVLFAEDC